jgi:hypothetical protein
LPKIKKKTFEKKKKKNRDGKVDLAWSCEKGKKDGPHNLQEIRLFGINTKKATRQVQKHFKQIN